VDVRRSLLSFLLVLLASASALSQPAAGKLRGQVFGTDDTKTRFRPVANAILRFESEGKTSVLVNADQWGEYTASLPPGIWAATAVFDKDGKEVELMSGMNFAVQVDSEKVGTLTIVTRGDFPDLLTILRVEPASAVDGVETEFTVEVTYRLVSVLEGVVQVGFNSFDPIGYAMIDAQPVEAGVGTLTMKAKVVPRDWKEKGHFRVFVNISDRNHGLKYFPFAGDEKKIEFRTGKKTENEQ